MTDVHNAQIRSYNMSRIGSKNTKPELLVRKFLFSKGFRFKLHVRNLPGKPDLVLPKYKTVIFVHGCFWHGHEHCRYFVIPKTRTEWWMEKINRNRTFDMIHEGRLREEGWNVIVIYECALKKERQEETLAEIARRLLQIKMDLD
ncbi:very short patch repair endonuclease [Chitinophaga caseinilytica]|uniref:very short patch repair endonuclease n=1 Tax=Chitinophaga caseinilytica TaxID=2267521 RepID=UPI003C2FA658